MSISKPLDPAKTAFIESAIAHGVLLFGTYTLKSGRYVTFTSTSTMMEMEINSSRIIPASLLTFSMPVYFIPDHCSVLPRMLMGRS